MNEKKTAYVALRGDRPYIYYQIYYGDEPSTIPSAWIGPFRDATDAENAAEDLARIGNLELIWRN